MMTNKPKYAISPDKLATARGALIVALGRDVKWEDFADMADLNIGTICNIRYGRSGGTPRTCGKIVDMLRSNGVAISDDDLLIPA